MSQAQTTFHPRRHDVDWLRAIALLLLVVYHIAIAFQPWGHLIFIPQNEDSLPLLWIPMSALNIWRIPLLFLISGMGVRFAMERRNGRELLKERCQRILVPLVFGFFVMGPICGYFALLYYGKEPAYYPSAAHLWFLVNLTCYTLLALPFLLFLKRNPDSPIARLLRSCCSTPWGLSLFSLPLIAEAILMRPQYYSIFANSWHGFWLGLLVFLTGFILASMSKEFRPAAEKGRHIFLALALVLFFWRLFQQDSDSERGARLAIESWFWILAALAYASRHLDRPSPSLSFLSARVFPLYILHLPIQYGLSLLILPMTLSAGQKFVLLVLFTFGLSLAMTLLVERISILRPLFGLKLKAKRTS